MFPFLHKSLAEIARGKRSTAGARKRGNRLQFECLESRCLLFAAPSPIQDLDDYETRPATLLPDVPSLIGVSSGTQSRNNFAPPAESGYRSRLPIQPSDDDAGLGKMPYVPPVDYPNSPSPPEAPPDTSASGGLIQIGEFDAKGIPATVLQSATEKEIRGVLEILSALQYVPGANHQHAAGLSVASTADVGNTVPGTLNSQPFSRDPSEGGMVALERDLRIKEPATDKRNAGEQGELPTHVSVHMDSVSGRFQAFEVSTAEELPLPPPAPHAFSEPTRLPLAPESAVTPSPTGEPVTEVPLETNSAAFSPCVQEGARAKDDSPVARPPTSAASTTPALYTAAAAALLAYAARSACPPDSRDPDNRKTLAACFPTLSLWTQKIVKCLNTARKLLLGTS
jgi:hypothetical protein